MKAKLELGDDPEVAAAAAQAPEEVGVLRLARLDELALGGDEVDGEQLVDRQPVLALQPADAAAERQAGDAGVGDDPARRREPERLGLAVELAPEHAGLRPRRARLRIDADALHRPEVDDDAAVADRHGPGSCGRRLGRRPGGRCSVANLTAAITSAAPAQRAISAGKRSIDPFQTLRCSS